MLTALNDPNEEIRKMAFDLIEEMGAQFEEEEEEKFRNNKQYGVDCEWVQGRKSFEDLKFPDPLKTRPRVGARHIMKNYTRRYLKALYKEITDWVEES